MLSAMRGLLKNFRYVILVCALASVVHYITNNKAFTFNAREVKKIAETYSGQHPNTAMSKILTDLRRLYATHLVPSTETNWFTLGGPLSMKMFLIHVSLTEYLAIVGSPIKTSGHAGFHWMNQSCSVLVGNVQRWKDGAQLSRENFRPGDHIRFAMFEGSVVELAEDTWSLCYGRGVVPASAPYLALNFATHSVDPLTPARLLFTSGRSAVREVFLWLQECYFFYLHKFTGK